MGVGVVVLKKVEGVLVSVFVEVAESRAEGEGVADSRKGGK